MSTRSSTRNLFPPLKDPERTIRRRTRVDPNSLNNFKEINMAANGNGDDRLPPAGGGLPVPDLRTMEELCQPTLNGQGGPIAPIAIQATNFGLKNDMIQQVQNSCQFHGLPGDDANKHLDKFLHVTQSIKVNRPSSRSLSSLLDTSCHRLLRNEITNLCQHPDESLFEAWERYKLSIDRFPNHNMLPVTQIDTFYNRLTLRHRDTINAAAGGTFMKRRPKECYDLIKNMTAHHNDWDTSAQRSVSSSSITSSSDPEIVALKAEMVSPPRSGVAYKGPTIPITSSSSKVMERETELVVAPVVEPVEAPVSDPKPKPKPLIPYPSRLNDQKLREKANNQMEKFFQIFQDLHFDISFTDALILMPKFASTNKSLLSNKEKLFELERTPLNEHCSEVLLKKLLEKLGDPDKFLIPCDFPRMDYSQEVLRFSVSGNPTPSMEPIVSTSSPTLTPFGDSDFLLEETDAFLAIKDEPISSEINDSYYDSKGFEVTQASSAWKLSDIKGINPEFCTHKILMEDDFKPAVQHQRRVNPKIHEVIKKEVLKLLDAGLIYPISDSPWVSPVHCVPKKGGFTVVENEENELIPTRLVTGWRVCIDYRKLNDATRKDHFPLPFMDQMLERLAGNEYYCFLDGFSGYFQIPIDPQDQEKTTFTCPYGTFAYRRKGV
ncbi:hypothetical protein Tco_0695524 [Tanacetum coccineum]